MTPWLSPFSCTRHQKEVVIICRINELGSLIFWPWVVPSYLINHCTSVWAETTYLSPSAFSGLVCHAVPLEAEGSPPAAAVVTFSFCLSTFSCDISTAWPPRPVFPIQKSMGAVWAFCCGFRKSLDLDGLVCLRTCSDVCLALVRERSHGETGSWRSQGDARLLWSKAFQKLTSLLSTFILTNIFSILPHRTPNFQPVDIGKGLATSKSL